MNNPPTIAIITNPLTNDSVRIDFLHLKKVAVILRSINHKLRQQILRVIDEHKKITVTELYIKLRLEQSVASQHLAILRRAGIVGTERDGKFIYYFIKYDRVKDISRFVEELLA